MAVRDLPSRPNLEQYRKQVKELLKRWKASDPKTTRQLADAQHAIARDHGFDTWKKFSNEITSRPALGRVRRPRGHSERVVEAPTKARRERRVVQRNAAWLGGALDGGNGGRRTLHDGN